MANDRYISVYFLYKRELYDIVQSNHYSRTKRKVKNNKKFNNTILVKQIHYALGENYKKELNKEQSKEGVIKVNLYQVFKGFKMLYIFHFISFPLKQILTH